MVAHIRLRSGSKPCTPWGIFRERIAPPSDKSPRKSKLFCTHFVIRVRAGADQVSTEILRIARPVKKKPSGWPNCSPDKNRNGRNEIRALLENRRTRNDRECGRSQRGQGWGSTRLELATSAATALVLQQSASLGDATDWDLVVCYAHGQ